MHHVAINEKDGQDDDYLYVDSVEGIHVVMTLNSAVGWPAVKDFSSRFSRALAHAKPDIFYRQHLQGRTQEADIHRRAA